jgi:hypothetical protein
MASELELASRLPNRGALRQSLVGPFAYTVAAAIGVAILWWSCAGPEPIILELTDSRGTALLKLPKMSTKLLFW